MTAKKKPIEPESKEPMPTVDEVYRPMAVAEPTPLERLDAMETQVKVMKNWINRHNRQHYGRDAV